MLKKNGTNDEEESNNSDPDNINYLKIISNVIETISQILEDIIKENIETEKDETDTHHQQVLTAFFVKKPPNKPINEYIQRIIRYAKPEPSTVIISLYYIDKLCDKTDLELSSNNIHRLILSSIIIAIKYNEDDYYSNTYYAKVGGISLEELNKLEYEMLQLLDFNTYIDDQFYEKYEMQLIQNDEG